MMSFAGLSTMLNRGEKYSIEFDWYFGKNEGKLIAEEYLTDVIDYFKERMLWKRSELPISEMYKIQEMVNGLFNLRNAIMDAEEIEMKVED